MELNTFLYKYYQENDDDDFTDFIYTAGLVPETEGLIWCLKLCPKLGDFLIGYSEISIKALHSWYTEITKEEFMEVYLDIDQELRKRMGWT